MNLILCSTSVGFILPGIYAFTTGDSWLGLISILTSLFSVNYWFHETNDLRYTLDSIMSRISFITFTYRAITYVKNPTILLYGWINWFVLVLSFALSRYHQRYGGPWWVPHCLFHICTTIGQVLVIRGSSL